METMITGVTVFVCVFSLCYLHDQKQKLVRAVRQYQALFEGQFPKRITVADALDPPSVFEIRRLGGGEAGAP